MCKSPKNLLLTEKVIEYEHLNTNCTIVGSNNLHLVKKPIVTSVSPVYSNPSPGPYKSPSPQAMKPPTPQPTYPGNHHHHHHHHLPFESHLKT